jgi:endoglucanase
MVSRLDHPGRAVLAVVTLVLSLMLVACSTTKQQPSTSSRSPAAAGTPTVGPARPAPALRVSGNSLVDATGKPVQLRGVNRAGAEYACIQGWGFIDGPSDDASVAAIASWDANVVRLPLNEDCWVGRNTPNPAYAGAAYRTAVQEYVTRLHDHGLAAILDLHWAEAGASPATAQAKMADAAHAPEFWTSVATTFLHDQSVLFDLYNEPHDISWSCWRDGCQLPEGWAAAGMQSLLNAVRATGAKQPVVMSGSAYANDLSGWLANAPSDPANQLVAGFHVYNFNVCASVACWDERVAPVATKVPVITGEVGEDDGTPRFLNGYLPWADAHGVSYLGWTWNAWQSPTSLISAYDGTPTSYGVGLRDHLRKSST